MKSKIIFMHEMNIFTHEMADARSEYEAEAIRNAWWDYIHNTELKEEECDGFCEFAMQCFFARISELEILWNQYKELKESLNELKKYFNMEGD